MHGLEVLIFLSVFVLLQYLTPFVLARFVLVCLILIWFVYKDCSSSAMAQTY